MNGEPRQRAVELSVPGCHRRLSFHAGPVGVQVREMLRDRVMALATCFAALVERRRRYFLVASVLFLELCVFTSFSRSEAIGQQTGPKNPPLIIKSVAGQDLFEFYCATCHGRDGKGGGPAARALRVPPPDLTMLASRNGGPFPDARVEAFVTGERDMPAAHGTGDMPIWGRVFRGLDANDRLNRVRIRNIVGYLASLQTK